MESESQNLQVVSQKHTYQVNLTLVENITQQIKRLLGLESFELSVEFIPENEMQDLNRTYRGKDRSTDVLSFPQQEWDEAPTIEIPHEIRNLAKKAKPPFPALLGDLVICPEVANDHAQEIGHGLDREVCFLLVHGILHLCGHDHEEEQEEEIMTNQQKLIMSHLDSLSSRPIWENCVRII